MQKNKNRRGLALGAIVAMVSSLFVFSAPAKASEDSVVAYPFTGLVAQTSIPAGEKFDLGFRYGTGVASSLRTPGTPFGIIVSKPAGEEVKVTLSGAGNDVTDANAAVRSDVNPTNGTSTSSTVETTGTEAVFGLNSSGSPKVEIWLSENTSVSASVTITVTPFLDLDGDSAFDSGEPLGGAVSITYFPHTAFNASVSVAQMLVGETDQTISWAVAANAAINWTQADKNFGVVYNAGSLQITRSDSVSATALADATAATAYDLNGVADSLISTGSARAYSASLGITNHAAVASQTFSATVYYGTGPIKTSTTVQAQNIAVLGTVMTYSRGVNITESDATNAEVRLNSAVTITAYPYTASATQAAAVASAVTVSAVGSAMTFDADSGVIVDGTTYTSSAALLAAGFTLAAGDTSFTFASFGQTDGATANQYVRFVLSAQQRTSSLDLHLEAASQTVAYVPTTVAGLAGAAKTFAVTAYDQWGQASVRTDQRIAASVVLGGSTSTTVSAAVVAGKASVTVTPTPAARTGSATITLTLQTFNQAAQNWENTGTADTATWNIYSYTAGTEAFTSRTVSLSASISYGVNLSWSDTVTIGVLNSFSDVVVSAPGLMIQNADATSTTASDTLTVAANGQALNVKFTSRLAGTYTVTFTAGTATTTSQIVVDPAAHDAGATLTFDKTAIAAGETSTITGTLLDANGNPVATGDTASVAVAWSGKGLPFGTSTAMATDANGELMFQVLVLSGEKGDGAIAATYKPAGAAVDTDNITVAYKVAVGSTTATSADQKVNAGSFKGYVAVYAKGYEGQRLSAKVGKDWVVVASLASNFERVVEFTGAGYTIAVRIYIDRVLVDTITVTTK